MGFKLTFAAIKPHKIYACGVFRHSIIEGSFEVIRFHFISPYMNTDR
jgi:hypothetical protein